VWTQEGGQGHEEALAAFHRALAVQRAWGCGDATDEELSEAVEEACAAIRWAARQQGAEHCD
jgi:hypothetical protein